MIVLVSDKELIFLCDIFNIFFSGFQLNLLQLLQGLNSTYQPLLLVLRTDVFCQVLSCVDDPLFLYYQICQNDTIFTLFRKLKVLKERKQRRSHLE